MSKPPVLVSRNLIHKNPLTALIKPVVGAITSQLGKKGFKEGAKKLATTALGGDSKVGMAQNALGMVQRQGALSQQRTQSREDRARSMLNAGIRGDAQKSEPMNIAWRRIMKERVSPEAKRHKLEYDKKYESSPERVKYRVELNRERRKRGMYGDHSGKDISHTQGGKLTVESEHDNRARHFKDKGTLREIAKGAKEDIELLQNLLSGPMDGHDQIIVDALEQKINEEEESEEEEYIPHEFFL